MRGGKGALAILLALTALLVVGVPVGSAHQRHLLPTFVNPDGSGTVSAEYRPGGVAWEACTSHLTECKDWGRGQEIGTGGAPAGTVFRVSSALVRGTEMSPEWKGPLKALEPPRVSGVIQANEYVSPVPGRWRGGWKGETAEMQLAACETEAGEGCVSITSPRLFRQGCPFNASLYLDPRFTGWFLRVANEQSGGPHAHASSAIYSPSGATWGFDPVWSRSRRVSVAIVGQIAPATSPARGECGPPPPPAATISAEGVARVECAGGCSASLVGMRRGHRQSISRQAFGYGLLEQAAALELKLPPAALAKLGSGKVKLNVEVDGAVLARRTIRTPNS